MPSYPLLPAIGASLVVSAIAGIGASVPLLRRRLLAKRLPAAASFAAGVLLGDALLHLLPASLQHGLASTNVGIWLLVGIAAFFAVECVLRMMPRIIAAAPQSYVVVTRMDIVGDAVHHAMDGLLIGSAFLVGMPIGIMTVIAIALHEAARKFGVAGVLLMGGMRPDRAMLLVWINTLACPLGVYALFALARSPTLLGPLLAAAGGGALYLACSDFLPSAWQASGIRPSPGVATGLALGIGAIWLCEALEQLAG